MYYNNIYVGEQIDIVFQYTNSCEMVTLKKPSVPTSTSGMSMTLKSALRLTARKHT